METLNEYVAQHLITQMADKLVKIKVLEHEIEALKKENERLTDIVDCLDKKLHNREFIESMYKIYFYGGEGT